MGPGGTARRPTSYQQGLSITVIAGALRHPAVVLAGRSLRWWSLARWSDDWNGSRSSVVGSRRTYDLIADDGDSDARRRTEDGVDGEREEGTASIKCTGSVMWVDGGGGDGGCVTLQCLPCDRTLIQFSDSCNWPSPVCLLPPPLLTEFSHGGNDA